MSEGPDFLCIGAPKAGTRWLYDQLAWHPDAWMPPIKELHAFDLRPREGRRTRFLRRAASLRKRGLNSHNAKRAADLLPPLTERDVEFLEQLGVGSGPEIDFGWYRRLFSAKGSDITGELTPAYCALPLATVQQIAEQLPDIKVIFLIRDPIARAWSHLQMEHRYSRVSLDDIDAVRAFIETPVVQMKSKPTMTVRLWRSVFPEKQFHYEFFDDIVQSPARVRRSIMEFIGLDAARGSDVIPADFNRKSVRTKFPLTSELKDLLVETFRDEIERCVQEFGEPALRWRNAYAAA